MRSYFLLLAGMLLVLLSACSGGKSLETARAGEDSYMEGDFQAAYDLSEQLIREMESRGKNASGEIYAIAGASAYELEEYAKSLSYLVKAQQQDYTGKELYLYLVRNYRHIDNLSKEITALESYLDKYPEGEHVGTIRGRLFETCLESENFELADELWIEMDSTDREEVENLEVFLKLNRIQENDGLCDTLTGQILTKSPENETALSWLGESLFWKAENTYQHQMKAYKQNRTHKQYAILLEAFKQVNSDFKKSLECYLKLWDIAPKPEYANFLANIYTRLDDQDKADYYRKRTN